MQNKVTELQDVILPPADVKKLQLRLQGSIAATVHSGPFAYAKAFLDPKNKDKIIDELRLVKIDDLKQIFRWVDLVIFLSVCLYVRHVSGVLLTEGLRNVFDKESEKLDFFLCGIGNTSQVSFGQY